MLTVSYLCLLSEYILLNFMSFKKFLSDCEVCSLNTQERHAHSYFYAVLIMHMIYFIFV